MSERPTPAQTVDPAESAVPASPHLDPEQGEERKRLRDSMAGNALVLVIATAVILAGVWLVNTLLRSPDAEAEAAEASGGVSQVELTGELSDAAPEVGKPAPDFAVLDIEGNVVTLSELQGRPVWLIFGATWCTNCRSETAEIEAVREQLGDDVAIVAVYVGESIQTVAGYAERLGLTYPQIADSYTDLGSLYRVMGLPEHVFVDADGAIAEIRVGAITEQTAVASLQALTP